VPVVASRLDGVPELVDDASGMLVAPDDPETVRAALTQLLDDPERRAQMGRAGAARVAERFTPERHAQELARVYEDAITAATRRTSRRNAQVRSVRNDKYSLRR
jgi:glycosyltransferase involved in cell wall biosynthesis